MKHSMEKWAESRKPISNTSMARICHLSSLFPFPQVMLSSITDYFITHGIELDRVHLYKDISDAIRDVHMKGVITNGLKKIWNNTFCRGMKSMLG